MPTNEEQVYTPDESVEENETPEENDDEDTSDEDTSDDDSSDEDDSEKDWKAEAMKYKDIAKRRKEKLKKLQTEEKPETPEKKESKETKKQETPDTDQLTIKEVLRLRNQGYSDDEILEIDEQASDMGVPLSKLLDNPIFKSGIEKQREKKKVDQGTPTPSSKKFTYKKKTWDEIVKSGTPEEKKEAYNKMMQGGK